MGSFSFFERENIISALAGGSFDLLVIGGGITGAGIALDAATRGLRVALIEKHDFAYGTSSRSTKLIHGGLRYLKQLEFNLVREVGSERAVVHRLAPHLVIPEKMLLPLSDGKSMGYWLTSIGLKIYDFLAGVTDQDRRRMLSRAETLKAEPLLRTQGINGGALYAEYRTDDARLTTEILKSAVRHGAVAVNYAEAKSFIKEAGRITAVSVADRKTDRLFEIKAVAVVNAGGPWVDLIREADGSKQGSTLHLTKGVHIVVSKEKLPVRQSVYFEVSDGRMIFAIPRGTVTYIGTTDTDYHGIQEDVKTDAADAEYLLNAVNENFSIRPLSKVDIISSWAGLRPLIHEEGKSASELSRKDEVFVSPSGLISIAGGKLTGYRKMAERVVDLVIETFFSERIFGDCVTERVLPGHHFNSFEEVKKFRVQIQSKATPEVSSSHLLRLADTYGQAAIEIINKATEHGFTPSALLHAEIEYCIREEMVTGMEDFFIRRTGMLYFHTEELNYFIDEAAACFQKLLSWSDEERERQKKTLLVELETAHLKIET